MQTAGTTGRTPDNIDNQDKETIKWQQRISSKNSNGAA
ncbi:hypothetical protein HMPREF9720_0961 [Alistipes sp. HGB5]|nr:hypothetical protein HMPREF9720_0961 [Alistipes sp. HGB5]